MRKNIVKVYKLLSGIGKGEPGTTIYHLSRQMWGATRAAGRRQSQNKQNAASGPTKSLFWKIILTRATSPDETWLNEPQISARLTEVQVWLITGNLCERLSQLKGRQILSVNPKKSNFSLFLSWKWHENGLWTFHMLVMAATFSSWSMAQVGSNSHLLLPRVYHLVLQNTPKVLANEEHQTSNSQGPVV